MAFLLIPVVLIDVPSSLNLNPQAFFFIIFPMFNKSLKTIQVSCRKFQQLSNASNQITNAINQNWDEISSME